MKKVLVIGARGRIGSFLVNRLVTAGWEVTALSRSERKPYAYKKRCGIACARYSCRENGLRKPTL